MNKHTLVALVVIGPLALALRGTEFKGTVKSVAGDSILVAMEGDVMPPVGAKAEIFFKLAGSDDEVSVATGSALRIEHGDLRVKIDNATGSVEQGQLVRFSSSSFATPAASLPGTPSLPQATPETAAPPTADEAARFFNEGHAKFEARDWKGAIAAYSKSIELNPTRAAAYANRGSAYGGLKQSERGLADLNESIRLDPNNSNSHVMRGDCYADLHQFKRAIEDYDEAIRLNPKNPKAYNDRGTVYVELGQNKIALEDFNKAIELNPAQVEALTNRARTYQAMGRTQLAKRDFARLKELKTKPH